MTTNETLCAIWHHSYNLNNVKNTPIEECYFYLSCKLKPQTLQKVLLLHGYFSSFQIVQMVSNRANPLKYVAAKSFLLSSKEITSCSLNISMSLKILPISRMIQLVQVIEAFKTNIYLFKINNDRNTIKRCKLYSRLTIKKIEILNLNTKYSHPENILQLKIIGACILKTKIYSVSHSKLLALLKDSNYSSFTNNNE